MARKSVEAPARLAPADLRPLRDLVGDGAIDYAIVCTAFHFINRIADLLDVPPESIPEGLRRFEPLRKASVWLGSLVMGRMDLDNRRYAATFEQAAAELDPVFRAAAGAPLGDRLDALAGRPHVLEVFRHALEERDVRSSLDRSTIATVHAVCADALPADRDEAFGFHARPDDPVEAFAFVGTRYPARTTEAMIDALRERGFDDLGVLDLAIAVADANQWLRLSSLLDLDRDLFLLPAPDAATAVA